MTESNYTLLNTVQCSISSYKSIEQEFRMVKVGTKWFHQVCVISNNLLRYFSWKCSISRPTACPINWNYKVLMTRASTKVAAATSSSPTICSSTTVTGVLEDSSTSAFFGTGVIRLCSFFLCCFSVSRVFTRAPQIWDKEIILIEKRLIKGKPVMNK